MDIKETRDLWAAIAAVWVRANAAIKDDHKFSWVETLSFAMEWRVIAKALAGIAQVPSELLDLDEAELAILKADIREMLISVGYTHRTSDLVDKCLEWVRFTLATVLFIKNAPPTAEPV